MEEWLVFLGKGWRSGSGRMGEPQDLGGLTVLWNGQGAGSI